MKNDRTAKVVMTAMMMCLIILATMLVKIPVPLTHGYVHFGDAMIFLSVLILGRRYGTIAAGFGSALGDVIGGFAYFAPWTLIVKGGMALIMSLCLSEHSSRVREVFGMIVGGAFMTAGYFLVEGVLYGSFATAALEVPWNIGQFAIGMVLATAIATVLERTPAEQFFTYKFS